MCDIIVVVASGPITQLPCSLALMNAGITYYALRNVLISADIVVKKANCTWPIKVYKRHKSGILIMDIRYLLRREKCIDM